MSLFSDVCELVSEVKTDFKEFKQDISSDLVEIKDDCIELYDKKSLDLTCITSEFMNEITNRVMWNIDDLIEGIEKPSDFLKCFLLIPTVPFISAGEITINIMKIGERNNLRKRKSGFNKKYEVLKTEINAEIDENQNIIFKKNINNQISECYQLSKEFNDELTMINSYILETEKNIKKLKKQISTLKTKKNKKAQDNLKQLTEISDTLSETLIEKYEYKMFLKNKVELMANSINTLNNSLQNR